MELVIGAVITVITEFTKWLAKKVGQELATAIIYLVGLVASVAYVVGDGVMSGELVFGWGIVGQVATIFGLAVAANEVLLKRFIKPALNKVKKK